MFWWNWHIEATVHSVVLSYPQTSALTMKRRRERFQYIDPNILDGHRPAIAHNVQFHQTKRQRTKEFTKSHKIQQNPTNIHKHTEHDDNLSVPALTNSSGGATATALQNGRMEMEIPGH